MPGRKQPPMREEDKEREYRLMQKRGRGETTNGRIGRESGVRILKREAVDGEAS